MWIIIGIAAAAVVLIAALWRAPTRGHNEPIDDAFDRALHGDRKDS